MSDLIKSKAVRLLTPTIIGIIGTVIALTMPANHAAFCAGIVLPVL